MEVLAQRKNDDMTPKHVEDAVEKADKIAGGSWPPIWRYPPPSQADAVWNALKPARDYVEQQTGESMGRNHNGNLREPVIDARAQILTIEMPVNAPKRAGIKAFADET